MAILLCSSLSATEPAPPALSPLASSPDWSRLDAFQETISESEFRQLLERHYAPREAWKATIEIDSQAARIATRPGEFYTLRFSREPPSEARGMPPRSWRTVAELPPLEDPARPLAGLRIVIDPGHLGGGWAKMEERWFQIGEAEPVREGDMVLVVAERLKSRLEALGATVSMTRDSPDPVTDRRPADFEATAREQLRRSGRHAGEFTTRKQAEGLFYRNSEIRARADLINKKLRPDLVLCLHFNAEAWGDPTAPTLIERHHLHLLINGCYEAGELALEDVRFEMVLRLLSRQHETEGPLARAMIAPMADVTRLPPYTYPGTNALRLDDAGYLWARNLLANRLFDAPVIFLEPYVMNSVLDYPRIQAGDYPGLQRINGRLVPNLYDEYVEAVVRGVEAFYRAERPLLSPPPPPP